MSSNALNLVVKFAAIDKLTGGLKNIVKAGKGGAETVKNLQRELRVMERDLAKVHRQMAKGGGAGLSMAQRHLTEAIAETNRQLDREMGKLKRVERIQSGLGKVKIFSFDAGMKASLAVSLPLLALAKTSIDESRQGTIAAAQVEAGIKSMGNTVGRSLAQLREQATALMHTSLFDDDEIMQKVTAPMLTFGKITGATFDAAQLAAVNLSAKLGQDLQSSAIQLGKALNDPVKGITALKRVGVSFTAQQVDMIKSMVAANNVAGAQAIILKEMNTEFGGAAMAARNADPAGAIALSFGELQQAIGDRLIPRLIPLIDKITAVMDAFGSLSPAVQDGILMFGAAAVVLGPLLLAIGGIAAGISGLVALAPVLTAAFGAIVVGIGAVSAPVLAIGAAMVAVAYLIYANWGAISGFFARTWSAISSAVQNNWTAIRNVLLGAVVIFAPLVAVAIYVASLIYRNWDKIVSATHRVMAVLGQVFAPVITAGSAVLGFLGGLIGKFFSFGVNIVGGLIRGVLSMTGSVIKAFLSLAGSVGARFAAALGIKSPSRVFMAMGGHLANGLAIGIDQNARKPLRAIGRLSAGVAGAGALAMTPALAAPAQRSAAPAQAVEIHVHQQAGENAEALARRVAELVEKRGRRGGGYGDDF